MAYELDGLSKADIGRLREYGYIPDGCRTEPAGDGPLYRIAFPAAADREIAAGFLAGKQTEYDPITVAAIARYLSANGYRSLADVVRESFSGR